MELKASCKYILHSPRKMRRAADLVRGKDLEEALDILRYLPNRSAYYVARILRSAAANEFNLGGDDKVDEDRLYVKVIYINEGPRYKRIMYRAYGRATRVLKRTCHIHVVLDERPEGELSKRTRRRLSEKPTKGRAKKRTAKPEAVKGTKPKKKAEPEKKTKAKAKPKAKEKTKVDKKSKPKAKQKAKEAGKKKSAKSKDKEAEKKRKR